MKQSTHLMKHESRKAQKNKLVMMKNNILELEKDLKESEKKQNSPPLNQYLYQDAKKSSLWKIKT